MFRRNRRFSYLAPILLVAVWFSASGAFFAPPDGELLVYKVYVAGMALGEQRISTKAAMYGKEAALLVESRSDSYSFLGLLDFHEVRRLYWDPGGACPLAEQIVFSNRQGREETNLVFSAKTGQATYEHISVKGTVTRQSFAYPAGAQTDGSLFIYLRSFPWQHGQEGLKIWSPRETSWFPLAIEVAEDPLRVPLGTFAHPYRVRSKDKNYEIWLDRSQSHLPLEIRSQTNFGAAVAKLVEASSYR